MIFVANHPFPFNFHDTIAIYVAITVKEGQFVKRNWTNPGGLSKILQAASLSGDPHLSLDPEKFVKICEPISVPKSEDFFPKV